MRVSRGGRACGESGETSVMRAVKFGFWFEPVSESELSANKAADAAIPFNDPETGGLNALMGKTIMTAVSKAMYVSSNAAGRLEYHGRANGIKFAMRSIRASTLLLPARETKRRVHRGQREGRQALI